MLPVRSFSKGKTLNRELGLKYILIKESSYAGKLIHHNFVRVCKISTTRKAGEGAERGVSFAEVCPSLVPRTFTSRRSYISVTAAR